MALRISDLGTAPTVEETDLVEIAEVDGESPSGYSSYKTTILGIANKIATNTVFSGLVTTTKNLVGSINEVDGLLDLKESKADMEDDVTDIVVGLTDTQTATGNPVTITTVQEGLAKSAVVEFSPIQSGTGDPSPTNIRPISGRDSVDVVVTGTNQWDEEWEQGYIDSHGENTASTINIRSKNFIPIVPNTRYYLKSGYTTIVYCPIFFYDENKVFLSSNLQQVWNTVITTSSNAKYMRFYMNSAYGSVYNNDISINYPPTDTEYHAYNGQTKTITFPSTIYGGSHEFVSGKAESEWGYIASYSGETITEPWISDRDVYVEGTTPSTGAEVCYKLATPQEITLTPQKIELLKGANVLWTDGDNIIINYAKLPQGNLGALVDYIQQLEARVKALEEA